MPTARRRTRRPLSVPEQHELRIARRTTRMHPVMAAVMGGPSPEEARRTVARLGPREGAGKLEDSHSSVRVREALHLLNELVSRGVEYPDAEERVAHRYGLSAVEVRKVRSLYDRGATLEDSRRWHVPTISAVERAIPAGYCMDSRTDAHALSSRLADKFAPEHAYHAGLYDAIFEELYGKPWCTDNEDERSKIATRVRIVLQRWVGK